MRLALLLVVGFVALLIGAAALTPGFRLPWEPEAPATRVLFVGNSHTERNSVPEMVAELASAARVDPPIEVITLAQSGWGFVEHLDDGEALELLASGDIDVVVLQDQSQRPAFTFDRDRWERRFRDPAEQLISAARDAGVEPILFETWARRVGDPSNVRGDNYAQMQRRVIVGYDELARETGTRVAPVGRAWLEAVRERPTMPLWRPDQNHSSAAGAYLAALVLFGAITDESPIGNDYHAGLSQADIGYLQRHAHFTLAAAATPEPSAAG